MTGCNDYREELSAYMDGELTGDEREAVERHLDACPACADELAALRYTQQLCHQLEDVEPPASLTSDIMRAVRQKQQYQARQRYHRWYPVGAVAALLVVFFVGFSVTQFGPLQRGWQQLSQALPGVNDSDMRLAAPAPEFAPTPAPAPTPPRDMPDKIMSEAGTAADTAAGDGVRMIIKTGEMVLEVPDGQLGTKEASIVHLVDEVDGYIEHSSHWSETSGRQWAALTVRVPAAEFNRVLYAFDDGAKVLSRSAGASDVSEAYMDLDARVRNRQVQEGRLLEIMEKATNVDEIMRVENELARVRSEVESLTGRMRYFETVTSMSTISITIREVGSTIVEIANWWDDIKQAFVTNVRRLGILTASSLPYLVLAVVVWRVIRWLRRSRVSPD